MCQGASAEALRGSEGGNRMKYNAIPRLAHDRAEDAKAGETKPEQFQQQGSSERQSVHDTGGPTNTGARIISEQTRSYRRDVQVWGICESIMQLKTRNHVKNDQQNKIGVRIRVQRYAGRVSGVKGCEDMCNGVRGAAEDIMR